MNKFLIILFLLCSCAKKPIQKDANIPIIYMKGDWDEATAGDWRGDIGIYDAVHYGYGQCRFDTTGVWIFDSTPIRLYGGDENIWDSCGNIFQSSDSIIFSCGTGDTTKRK